MIAQFICILIADESLMCTGAAGRSMLPYDGDKSLSKESMSTAAA